MLRYNASLYLMYLTENLTFDETNNSAAYLENISFVLMSFSSTIESYNNELEEYNNYQNAIDEYKFFDEIR